MCLRAHAEFDALAVLLSYIYTHTRLYRLLLQLGIVHGTARY